MKRRRVLAVIGSAGIASTSGCAIATDLFGEDGENNRQPESQADSSDSPGESREQPDPQVDDYSPHLHRTDRSQSHTLK